MRKILPAKKPLRYSTLRSNRGKTTVYRLFSGAKVGHLVDGKYLASWDRLSYYQPPELPESTRNGGWRSNVARYRVPASPVAKQRQANHFPTASTDPIPERLHQIDLGSGIWDDPNGPDQITNPETRDSILCRPRLIEEAITSSRAWRGRSCDSRTGQGHKLRLGRPPKRQRRKADDPQ